MNTLKFALRKKQVRIDIVKGVFCQLKAMKNSLLVVRRSGVVLCMKGLLLSKLQST